MPDSLEIGPSTILGHFTDWSESVKASSSQH